ncbi:DUF4167 domain-containing protein [Azospirillum sp. INR13]|uniref:DUF4167 domain-containing protein n=1 Tax=Azospirillum sp. INR13 TaxID=2596919 RepID=UPI0018927719|nr:DUF4167 domain-containing protein [Azospirillum sp. INR13]MBF5096542.1 DUF4167 domain-containing protein [Azospirillum sp. INR13]
MSTSNPTGKHFSRPAFGKTRSQISPSQGGARPATRVNGTAQQKQAQWLARAADAERSGDAVEAELCRQYAEHFFRVSRGQD